MSRKRKRKRNTSDFHNIRIIPDRQQATDVAGAIKLYQTGELQQAEGICRQIIQQDPDNAEALNLLGVIAHQFGKHDTASELIRRAIEKKPGEANFYNNLGLVLTKQERHEDAMASYRRAVALNSNYPEAHYHLGNLLLDQGKLDSAIEHYQQALRLKPDFADAHNNLGNALMAQGKFDEAIEHYQEALRLEPGFADAHNSLGLAFMGQGKLDEAIEHYRKAMEINSESAGAYSNLLLTLNYQHIADPVQNFAEHQRWARKHAARFESAIQPHFNDCTPSRRLRIGYVSPDFRLHSVAFFLEPILAAHDHDSHEIFCYSDVALPDGVTERLQGLADCWRNIQSLTHEQVGDQVRKDQIDILVDLAGHTGNNRMLMFARKPAPVQVSYLGYPNTTGLSTMDYKITDYYADPEGQSDALYTEELIRLSHCFLCYQPPRESPDVAKLPALETGTVTFGSFNNLSKVTPEVIALWSSILTAVPNAVMIMKFRALADIGTRQCVLESFISNGISSQRVILIGDISSTNQHLRLYNHIDIGLDTFPYNGTTTTCEALWMGVPVITMAGDRHGSRVGLSLLSNVGLSDLIAESTENYVEKAVHLAGDLKRLRDLRANLRGMMSDSPLMDAHGFTHALEEAYRQMWHRWCGQTPDGHLERENASLHTERTHIVYKPSDSEQSITKRQNSAKSKARKLHIGGSVSHHEWEVFNAVPATYVDHVGDAKDLSRFSDETFVEIYASHVLEHFDYVDELNAVLKEWYRVLRPGGMLYISVPDMNKLANLFLMKDKLSLQERFHVMRMMFGGHTDTYDYHKVGFDKEILESFLINAGFSNLKLFDDFGIFKDTSTMNFHGIPISVNIKAEKAVVAPGKTKKIYTAAKTIDIFDDDIFLVSYPRSGNTWLRFLLASIIHNAHNIDFKLIEKYAPDLYMHDNNYLLTLNRPRIIKSHEKYNRDYNNVVYLFRDVRDVVISMYYYLRKQRSTLHFDEYFKLFIDGKTFQNLNFGSWPENVRSWMENKTNITFVKYEDVLSNPQKAILKILNYLHIDYEDQNVNDAIEKYDFRNMAKIERNTHGVNYLDTSKEIRFIRQGTRGQWKSFLHDRHVNILKEKYGGLLIELGYETSCDW